VVSVAAGTGVALAGHDDARVGGSGGSGAGLSGRFGG